MHVKIRLFNTLQYVLLNNSNLYFWVYSLNFGYCI